MGSTELLTDKVSGKETIMKDTMSTTYGEWHSYFSNAQANYERLFAENCGKYDELLRSVTQRTARAECSKGGESLIGGFYSHSRLDLVVGGLSRGRRLKGTPKDGKYRFRYLFDEDSRLIATEAYSLQAGNSEPHEIMFLLDKGDEILSLSFSLCRSEKPVLKMICTTKFVDKRVSSFEWASVRNGRCHEITKELYEYTEGGLLKKIAFPSFLQGSSAGELIAHTQEEYVLDRDGDGKFTLFSVVKDIGGVIKDSGFVYTVGGSIDYPYDGEGAPLPVRPKGNAKKSGGKSAVSFEEYLYNRALSIISGWDEKGIYAISFLVNANQAYEYKGVNNVPSFEISYNTESDCSGASAMSEKRWNYAFWRQDSAAVIEPDDSDEGMELLFRWYRQLGIKNIGQECPDEMYDEKMNYVGKGPAGYYELLTAVSNTARALQENGEIESRFGKIPIIVHDLEYAWYSIEATKNANPHGEADLFLAAMT